MKTSKTYRTWMVSYCVIILVTLLCSLLNFFLVNSAAKTEINKSNTRILENVRLNMDAYIEEMQRIATDVGSNPIFTKLLSGSLADDEYALQLKMAQDELGRYQGSNARIDEIMLYIKDSSYIVTPTRAATTELIYQTSFAGTDISYEQWLAIFEGIGKNELRSFYTATPDGANKNIVMLRSLPVLSKQPDGMLLVSIRSEVIEQTLNQAGFSEESFISLVNSNNDVIFSGSENYVTLIYDRLDEQNGFRQKIGGKNYVVSSIPSEAADIKYVLCIPSHTYNKTAILIRNIGFAGMLLLLTAGLLAAFWLLKKNYRPLAGLMEYVDSLRTGDTQEEAARDEFDIVKNAMNEIVSEKTLIQNKLNQQNNTLRNNLLQNILKGKAPNDIQMDDVMFSFGVDFRGSNYLVLAFYVDYFDGLFEGSSKGAEEQAELAFLVVENICKEMLDQKVENVFSEVDDVIVSIINTDQTDAGRFIDQIKGILSQAKQVIKDNFYIDFTVAMSRLQSSQEAIAFAYAEAMEALNYKLVVGSGEIICYDEIGEADGHYSYPIETELMLVNAVKTGKREEAEAIVAKLFEDNFTKRNISVDMAKCFVFNLASTLIKLSDEIKLVYQVDCFDESRIGAVVNSDNVNEIEKNVLEIIRAVCQVTAQPKDAGVSKVVEKAEAYIKEHFCDFDLGLSSAAQQLGITPNYLSRVFKMHTGQGILQYINKIRFEEAKTLLVQTDLGIAEIAKSVGYENSNTFSRAFKKYTGVTPGKFRELSES